MEINCGAVKPLLDYLRDRYGAETMLSLIAASNMTVEYLEDPRNWMSYSYYCRLLDSVVSATGNPAAPLESSRDYTTLDSFGVISRFVGRMGSPSLTYVLMARYSSLWDKMNKWEVLDQKRRSCKMRIQMKYRQTRNNCLSLQGSLIAIPTLFGLPGAVLKEVQCACDGADACVYQIEWTQMPERYLGATGFTLGLAAGVATGYYFGWSTHFLVETLFFAIGGYFLGRSQDYRATLKKVYQQNAGQADSMLKLLRDVEELNKQLQDKVEQRTAQLKMTMEDLRKSQAKTLIAEKQSAVGVLAAGMAHEFNNPLNAICISAQSLNEDIDSQSKLKPQVEIIERAAGRCRRIVNDLLSYSREPRVRDGAQLADIVRSSVELFRHEHPGGIDVRMSIATGLPEIRLDRLQVQQAVLNLLKNASDAMKEHGIADVAVAGDSQKITISIRDHGPGMSEEIKKKIFDPFFTTKQSGKGLGLSITYQLVTRNGGTIDVSSQVGEGTVFEIVFPVTARSPE